VPRTVSTGERFSRFVGMGSVGFCLNLAITAFVHEVLTASEEVAFAVALITVFTFHFISGRYVIYGAAGGDPKRQLVRYALASGAFRGAEYVGFLALHTVAGFAYPVAIVAVLGTSFIAKFFIYGRVVFTGGPTLPP
jgi:putative flippase GtrA